MALVDHPFVEFLFQGEDFGVVLCVEGIIAHDLGQRWPSCPLRRNGTSHWHCFSVSGRACAFFF